jgi:hypothetical protein
MFGEVDPAFGGVDGAMPAAGLDAGRDGEAGDGVADHLALTAAETADGIAHEQDLGEVVAAESGAAKVFSGAELTLDLDAVQGVCPEVGGFTVGMLSSSARPFEFVLEVHVQRFLFSGCGGRSKSFSVVRRGLLGVRWVRMEWTAARAAGLASRVWRSRRSF